MWLSAMFTLREDIVQYSKLGNLDYKVSRLGYGAMRFPLDEHKKVLVDESIEIVHRALDLGVNFFDSAWLYHGSESETVLGKAIKGRRDKLIVQTKAWLHREYEEGETHRGCLEVALKKLSTDYVDFYLMHDVKWELYTSEKGKTWLTMARQAKEEGLIRHIGFSSHESPENVIKLIDSGNFESVTLQYNLLDRSYEDCIARAHERGMATMVMGPVAAGRLSEPTEQIKALMPGGVRTSSELALRFVLANPNVNVAMSGMTKTEWVEENVKTASREEPLSDSELVQIKEILAEKDRLAELYCTGCKYCMPCPSNVAIPSIFSMMNQHRLYGLTEIARSRYNGLGPESNEGQPATECVECGECEEKCPQKIEIIKQLKECHQILSEDTYEHKAECERKHSL